MAAWQKTPASSNIKDDHNSESVNDDNFLMVVIALLLMISSNFY
jgi:hypothetical protein